MKVHIADRLIGLDEYYFSEKLEQIRQLQVNGHDVINLGVGSPDLPPHPEVIKTLNEAALEPSNHAYQSYRGISELRTAIAEFTMQSFGGFSLDPAKEILPAMGSKECITHISLTFLNKRDQVLIPALAYPTYTSVTKMAEAKPVYFPLKESKNWEPDWEFLDNLDTTKAKLIWINYPHMPTGACGSHQIKQKFVAYARERNLILCHDNPYNFILNEYPRSIFQSDPDKEVSLELNSLSKSFNMAGWRVGWITGNEERIKAILKVKSNMDSGMFKPVQLAACCALALDSNWFESLNHTYRRRREAVFRFLDLFGFEYQQNNAGMFVWAKVKGEDGESFSQKLLSKHHIFVTPGFIFGKAGKYFIRVSLCTPEDRLNAAIKRINR